VICKSILDEFINAPKRIKLSRNNPRSNTKVSSKRQNKSLLDGREPLRQKTEESNPVINKEVANSLCVPL